jgi:hypothetical protein
MNNPLSYSSVKLDLLSKDGVRLKSASGFVMEAGNQYYLLTNRHVVSGSDIPAGGQQEPVIEPHILKTSIHIYSGVGEASHPLSMGIRKRMTVQLYDENNKQKWIEHQTNEQPRSMMDVIALPIQLDQFLRPSNAVIPEIQTHMGYWPDPQPKHWWAKISSIPISAIDVEVEYGPSDMVYVIGYPLGWAPTGPDKSSTAFWRTSSIASERGEIGMTLADAFFIDPCALEGMTGSPVIGMKNDHMKLLGVYSDSSTAEFGANAGLVWDASLVKELIGAS